jgi:putative addiction module component (TIGR02574 family)
MSSAHICPVANPPLLAQFLFVNAALTTELSRLSPAEKLQLVEKLWDDLAAGADRLPIPAWHEQVLTEDQALYQAKPLEGSSWAEAKARILGQS